MRIPRVVIRTRSESDAALILGNRRLRLYARGVELPGTPHGTVETLHRLMALNFSGVAVSGVTVSEPRVELKAVWPEYRLVLTGNPDQLAEYLKSMIHNFHSWRLFIRRQCVETIAAPSHSELAALVALGANNVKCELQDSSCRVEFGYMS